MRPSATILVLLAALLTVPASAQTPGDCETGSATRDLNIADVQARLYNTGALFYGAQSGNGDGYLVPKLTQNSPIYAAGLWIGGRVGGEIRTAAATYTNFEFWPGPLDANGNAPADCAAFDRIWVVSAADLAAYEATGVETPDLLDWPTYLGAETVDGDGDPFNYDLLAGDRPRLFGNQTAFWVMNDVGNDHEYTGLQPLGLEVQVTAFARASAEAAFDQATFYRFRLVNRSASVLDSAQVALFVDADLGSEASDDYIGTDTTRGMAFVYNADNSDPAYGIPPAAGYDLLDGAGASTYFTSTQTSPSGDPDTGEEVFNFIQGQWGDGSAIRAFASGYLQTQGDTTRFVFTGDPVTQGFWSERDSDGNNTPLTPGDRRHTVATPAFTLAPGATRDVHLAVLFGQGADHLASITTLRAASDAVQEAFDDGSLFAPAPLALLPTPTPTGPPDGAVFLDAPPTLAWEPVPGADHYVVEIDEPTTGRTRSVVVTELALTPTGLPVNQTGAFTWRVRAGGPGTAGSFSAPRRFFYYDFAPFIVGGGTGIVETASPFGDPCASDPGDAGCAAGYGGNTVWHDTTGGTVPDYYITGGSGAGAIVQLQPHIRTTRGDDLELRFTEAGGYAVYGIVTANSRIARVPFEVWNVRDAANPSDDVRMIPFLIFNTPSQFITDWTTQSPFTGMDQWIGGRDTPITEQINFYMPDRPDGYARFEAAALGFGGAGAVYDRTADGDTQVDLDPRTGAACANQGLYLDFCYHNTELTGGTGETPTRVALLTRVAIADLAGDGTVPPVGTTIRFVTLDRATEVTTEPATPEAPSGWALHAAYPNPFGGRTAAPTTTLRFDAPAAGRVRLAVYDVLGREVARLLDGPVAVGPHRVTLDGRGLASGLYVVVLEAGRERLTRRVVLVK